MIYTYGFKTSPLPSPLQVEPESHHISSTGMTEPLQGVHETMEEQSEEEKLVRTYCVKWGDEVRVVRQTGDIWEKDKPD